MLALDVLLSNLPSLNYGKVLFLAVSLKQNVSNSLWLSHPPGNGWAFVDHLVSPGGGELSENHFLGGGGGCIMSILLEAVNIILFSIFH